MLKVHPVIIFEKHPPFERTAPCFCESLERSLEGRSCPGFWTERVHMNRLKQGSPFTSNPPYITAEQTLWLLNPKHSGRVSPLLSA